MQNVKSKFSAVFSELPGCQCFACMCYFLHVHVNVSTHNTFPQKLDPIILIYTFTLSGWTSGLSNGKRPFYWMDGGLLVKPCVTNRVAAHIYNLSTWEQREVRTKGSRDVLEISRCVGCATQGGFKSRGL